MQVSLTSTDLEGVTNEELIQSYIKLSREYSAIMEAQENLKTELSDLQVLLPRLLALIIFFPCIPSV